MKYSFDMNIIYNNQKKYKLIIAVVGVEDTFAAAFFIS